jgi:hypothetical protein
MSESALQNIKENIGQLLEGMKAIEQREGFSLADVSREKWDASKKELEELQQNINDNELKDIGDASQRLAAAKAHLQSVISSIKGEVPAELAGALQALERQTVSTGADLGAAAAAAGNAERAASAAEGGQFLASVGEAVVGGAVAIAGFTGLKAALANSDEFRDASLQFGKMVGLDSPVQTMSTAALFEKTFSGITKNDRINENGQQLT